MHAVEDDGPAIPDVDADVTSESDDETVQPNVARVRDAQRLHRLGGNGDPDLAGIGCAAMVGQAGHIVVGVRETDVQRLRVGQ